ncbi:META domain-containing protein [Rufibacter roseus]|uniref:META domain-containing protein n=1 Tax=Rufibacter roseus TaxID=1567108 RepID=A0ABW2DLC3_9BACT|nr:META domain-containing protein [Rufibacter roseus]
MFSAIEPAAGNNESKTWSEMCATLVLTEEEEPEHSSKLWGYKMSGKMPINNYFGNFQVTDDALLRLSGTIKFVNLAYTKVGGMAKQMQFESYYMAALKSVDSYEVKDDVLTLRSAEGIVTLVFV